MKTPIVFDTNVLLRATREPSLQKKVLQVARRRFTPITSDATIEEMIDVTGRPHIIDTFGRDELRKMLDYMFKGMKRVQATHKLDPLRADPKDTMFLELALSANAGVIISGDKHLRSLKQYKMAHNLPIQIWSPEQFLKYEGQKRTQRWEQTLRAQGHQLS